MNTEDKPKQSVADLDGVQLGDRERVLFSYLSLQHFPIIAGVSLSELQVMSAARKIYVKHAQEDWSGLLTSMQNKLRSSDFINSMQEQRYEDAMALCFLLAAESMAFAIKVGIECEVRQKEKEAATHDTPSQESDGTLH